MKIVIPYTEILDVTRISLRGHKYDMVEMEGEYGYSQFFKKCWEKGEDFINVEHDSVVWPGAVQQLIDCPHPWCAYDFSSKSNWEVENSQGILHSIPLACMKFTKEFMEKIPHAWDEEVNWRECDVHLFKKASEAGLKIHQHYPGIVNGNKELFKLCKRELELS